MTSKRITRKWEIFAGRNKFVCDGRLMTAPHSGVFYLTVLLITGTCVLFFVFDCPFLSVRITPAIPCIGGALFAFTMGSLLRTSLSDPGVIPRATHDEASYIEKQIEVPNSCNSPTLRPPPRTKEVLVRGQPVKLKYCYTCKLFRPPRASHCSLCDNCVDRFDHHCPWVGNCVGKRNYRFFYMFVVSLAFLEVFIFSCAITHIVLLVRDPPGTPILNALGESPASAIVSFICFLSVWSVLGMAGFHTYLITTNQTTNEDIKGSFSSKRGQESPNPYSKGGVCGNCCYILCGPMTPSLIDRRGIITNENKEIENAQPKMTQPVVNAPPLPSIIPGRSHSLDFEDNVERYSRQRTASYTNLFKMEDRDAETGDVLDNGPLDVDDTIPNGIPMRNSCHLYSNIGQATYMNHNLDLDPVVLSEVGEPMVKYPRQHKSSYNNLYVLDETNGIEKQLDLNISHKPEMSNGPDTKKNEGHLYSNVSHMDYMNHNLDLDPVVLTGSKENLVDRESSHRKDRIEMLHQKSSTKSDELNHNTIKSPPSNAQSQMWADRLPRATTGQNGNIAVISDSKLSCDTTMIDTALDLDSLDGSTVSLWPAV